MINTIDARAWDERHARLMVPDHNRFDDAHDNVDYATRQDKLIPDATAVTIASWWQTSRGPGTTFAELATTGMGTAQGIERAIEDVRTADRPGNSDVAALDALSRWVAEHPSRNHLDQGHPAGHLYGCPACESYCWCEDLNRTEPCLYCAENESDGCRVDEDQCRAVPRSAAQGARRAQETARRFRSARHGGVTSTQGAPDRRSPGS